MIIVGFLNRLIFFFFFPYSLSFLYSLFFLLYQWLFPLLFVLGTPGSSVRSRSNCPWLLPLQPCWDPSLPWVVLGFVMHSMMTQCLPAGDKSDLTYHVSSGFLCSLFSPRGAAALGGDGPGTAAGGSKCCRRTAIMRCWGSFYWKLHLKKQR